MDKPLLFRYRIKSIIQPIIWGCIAGLGIGYITSLLDNIHPLGPMLRGLVIGFIIGFQIGFLEEILFQNIFRKKSFLLLLFIRTILYSFILIFWLLFINVISIALTSNQSFSETLLFYLEGKSLLRDLLIVIIAAFTIISLLQIRRLHNKGELSKFILGVYHKPKEIDTFFLFIDLKSSTTIAEKLGNIKYSEFLIDYFYDITDAILINEAEIYQYVGDEIILSWSLDDGIKDSRCINCYFDIRNSIELSKEKYLNKYGYYPEFNAGLHGGRVVVTWIGDIKKEIVYHGDVLNTTSRLEEYCKQHNKSLVVSEYILDKMKLAPHLKAEFIDEIQLRGKEKKIKIYNLEVITSLE